MAKPSFLLSIFLYFLAICSPAFCRSVSPKILKTTTFDVSASLQKTRSVVSAAAGGQDRPIQDEKSGISPDYLSSSANGTASFTLTLHPRDAIFRRPASHVDYRALTLARLARDTARANAIGNRVALALSGADRSQLHPLETDAVMADSGGLAGTIVSGSKQGSGEYFCRVGVGRPAKQMYMVLDTGSDVTWVQCRPCDECYQQEDPVFEPGASSTYAALSCSSQPCQSLETKACQNDRCLYQVSYGDGSYTLGDFVTETLTFGDSAAVNEIAIGCGHDNEGLFVGAAGLLGLGGGDLSFPSQISAPAFSYCLVDRDSSATSTLQFGPGSANGAITAPLLRNGKTDTFHYVKLTGLSVGGKMLSLSPSAFELDLESGSGGVILDSGTAITRLQSDAYTALRNAFVEGTRGFQSAPAVALFDTCYDLSSKAQVEVPTVALHFPGEKELRLPAKNYLIPVDSDGTFCLAFAATSSPMSIVGNVQQQGIRVGFDLKNSMVAFSPAGC